MKAVAEGSAFLIQREGQPPGFLVVARRAPRTAIAAVYVFQRAPVGAAEGDRYELPSPDLAVARGKISAKRMIEGDWPTLGVHASFRREEWPFAEVAWRPMGGRQWIGILLDDRNVVVEIGRREIAPDVASALPSRDLNGDGWPRYVLDRLDEERNNAALGAQLDGES